MLVVVLGLVIVLVQMWSVDAYMTVRSRGTCFVTYIYRLKSRVETVTHVIRAVHGTTRLEAWAFGGQLALSPTAESG